MNKKAITFMGTGKYKDTNYFFNDKTKLTKYFPLALEQFFELDEILVVLTEKARAQHWDALYSGFQNKEKIKTLDIPTGKSESDLWEIFNLISKSINSDDEIIFDITYSFRSQPLLALLVINYVQIIKSVKIKGLVYGAYEAEDKQTKQTPVFDLTPFINLMDWTTAAEMFLKTGYSTQLTRLVKQETKRIFT